MHLFRKKEIRTERKYDADKLIPVIRASICTSEKSAGFLEKDTGKFREVILIQSEKDLQQFKKQYGITGEIKTIY